MKLVKIANVANDFEAWAVMDLLEKNNIPCIKKEKEAGGYLKIVMGHSVYGADIYVDESDYDAAMELLNVMRTETETDAEGEDE